MPANFSLILDTTGPQDVAGEINGGLSVTNDADVLLAITTSSTDAVQAKVWGTVDPAADANIQATEGASSWITLTASIAVRLSTGDGAKTLHFKLRDDVWNESAEATASIALDTTGPIISMTDWDVDKVSKVVGKRTAHATFTPDGDLVAYTVRVVPAADSEHTAGTEIPTTNGSVNTSGGAATGGVAVTVTVDGADLELAAGGDGTWEIKVFGQDAAGNWSI